MKKIILIAVCLVVLSFLTIQLLYNQAFHNLYENLYENNVAGLNLCFLSNKKLGRGPWGEKFCYNKPSGLEGKSCKKAPDCGTASCVAEDGPNPTSGICRDYWHGCHATIDANGKVSNPVICTD